MLIDKALDFHHTVQALAEAMPTSGATARQDAIDLATKLGRQGYALIRTTEDDTLKSEAAAWLTRGEDT